MFAQRQTQQALRRLVASKPSIIGRMSAKGLTTPLALAPALQYQHRQLATQKITSAESYNILVEQRRKRPVAPHLTIYKPQLTWYLSGLNRITGVAVSGLFYVFGLTYLAAPLLGLHMESASIAAAFAAWPVAAKVATKFALALPFTFHSWNGLRHLTWDTGRAFSNKTVVRTGQAMLAATFISTAYLALVY